MIIEVTYKQKFMGEILTDTYYKTIDDENKQSEILDIRSALLSDLHVYDVKITPIEIQE